MPVSKTPATRKRSIRLRKPSLMTALWAVISLLFTISFLLIQGTLLMIVMVVSLLVTTISAFADFAADDTAVPAPKPRKAGSSTTRGNTASTRKRPAGKTTSRKRTCSARCKNSTKDVSTCRCVCGGRTHGKRGASTSAPAKPSQPVGEPLKRVV